MLGGDVGGEDRSMSGLPSRGEGKGGLERAAAAAPRPPPGLGEDGVALVAAARLEGALVLGVEPRPLSAIPPPRAPPPPPPPPPPRPPPRAWAA